MMDDKSERLQARSEAVAKAGKRAKNPSYLWLILGILLFIFSNGRWMVPVCSWLAPVFLLRFLRTRKGLAGLSILFLLLLVSTRIMYHEIIPSSLGILTYILVFYYAVLSVLPYLIYRLSIPGVSGFQGTLIFPAAAVGVEYINTVIFGSWASIAYTQFGNLPLMQTASLVGMWGITFIVLWFGAVGEWIWSFEFAWEKIKRGVLVYAVSLTAVLIYGGMRLSVFRPDTATVRIASLTTTREINLLKRDIQNAGFSSAINMAAEDRESLRDILDPLHESIFSSTRRVVRSGVSLVFWPEGMIVVLEEDQPDFIARGITLAKSEGIYFLMAYFVIPEGNPSVAGENKCVMINPSGEVEWEYLKTHPVPGATDKAGDGKIPVSATPFGRVSAVICYDMDFTGLIWKAGRRNVDIMLVPAWDWKAIDPLHAHMAVFRAIENGFSMIRQTGEGLSLAADPFGRIRAQMDHFTSEEHVMYARVPRSKVFTLFTSIGDAFAWTCLAGLLMPAVLRLLKRRIAHHH